MTWLQWKHHTAFVFDSHTKTNEVIQTLKQSSKLKAWFNLQSHYTLFPGVTLSPSTVWWVFLFCVHGPTFSFVYRYQQLVMPHKHSLQHIYSLFTNHSTHNKPAYPSCHWVRIRVHPGQFANPSQGHTEINETKNLTCMFLALGGSRSTQGAPSAYKGRTCNVPTEWPQLGLKPGNLLLWDNCAKWKHAVINACKTIRIENKNISFTKARRP